MSNIWFTSDHHFGHAKIMEYEPEARPFKTLEEMHEVLIDKWNSCIKDNDIVYHLGDFCFGRVNIPIAGLLKGNKKLILGNHDNYSINDYLSYFDTVHGLFNWDRCILTHIPIHPDQLGSRWFLNLHGHLHSKNVMNSGSWSLANKNFCAPAYLSHDLNYLNVSVEQNNLTPIHADVIRDRIKQL